MEQGSEARSQREELNKPSFRYEEIKRPHIPRKPVPVRDSNGTSSENQAQTASDYNKDASHYLKSLSGLDLDSVAPVLPPRPTPSPNVAVLSARINMADTYKTVNTTSSSFSAATSTSDTLSPTSSLSTSTSYTQKAYQEVRHFAGGFIHHPAQSTKQFSILRHSHGLIFYQGPTTSIAISIFADASLPTDRTVWLQSKGWTGNTGMRARAVTGWNSKWIDVTPSTRMNANQLNPSDERAWQRDIISFIRRADGHLRAKHKLRETAIIRVPVEAGDGYYRLVLCADGKKKVLCPSPVFRLLSTSTKPSSIRGASFITLPLEVGAKVLTVTAKASAATSFGNAVAPVTAAVQQQIQPYKPSWPRETALRAAYNLSGMSKKVTSTVQGADLSFDAEKDTAFGKGVYQDLLADGPNAPFPISFAGRADHESRITGEFDLPIFNLTVLAGPILQLLNGYYFGWARNSQGGHDEKSVPVDSSNHWHKAILSSISYDQAGSSRAGFTEKSKKAVAIYLVNDDEETIVLGARVEVQVLGFIRPPEPYAGQQSMEGPNNDEAQAEAAMFGAISDIEIAQAFLDQPAWAPESSTKEMESRSLGPSDRIKTSYAGTKTSLQRKIDRIPLHKAGIRFQTEKFGEEAVSNGGIYVER